MSRISTRTLACGMPLLVEEMPAVRSAAISWLVPAGSASDPENRLGDSALFSELLMRGAGELDSRQHADAFDRLGASRSADVGTYYLRVGSTMLGARVADVLPLLTSMVLAPRMEPDAVESARELALQALESLKDDPQERASIAVRERHHPSPINRSGMGNPDGLAAATRDGLLARWRELARPARSIFAIAGAINADEIASILDRLLGSWSGTTDPIPYNAAPTRGYAHETDASNQVQIIVKHDAPPERNPDARLERMVNSVLSGGMSGRLFTEVREKRGLCYSVSSGYRSERDFGAVTAYVGTTPERAQQSLDTLVAEMHRITTPEGRITPEEFSRAVVGAKSRLIFAGESTGARAGALGADFHRLGRTRSLEELAAEIDRLSLDELNAYLSKRKIGRATIQTLGPQALTPPVMLA